jgi:NAD(P)-dependent dehydrogenase (short-subunit alcohol dehydrogenase family)
MIIIAGAGASLRRGAEKHLNLLTNKIVYLSREKPADVNREDWIATRFDPSDGSIQKLSALEGPIEGLIWLASPFPRGLLASELDDVVSSAFVGGITYQTLLIKSVLAKMVTERFGRLVFAGSSGAHMGSTGAIVYMQIKAAQEALSKGISLEYGRFGITSNIIRLGVMEGGLSREMPVKYRQAMLDRTTSKAYTTNEDFWRAVSFVFSNPAVTGGEIAVDGGFF